MASYSSPSVSSIPEATTMTSSSSTGSNSSDSSDNFVAATESRINLIRKQVIVKNMLHASVCQVDVPVGGGCPRCKNCYAIRKVCQHASSCNKSLCSVPRCNTYRMAKKHVDACMSADCQVCSSARAELKFMTLINNTPAPSTLPTVNLRPKLRLGATQRLATPSSPTRPPAKPTMRCLTPMILGTRDTTPSPPSTPHKRSSPRSVVAQSTAVEPEHTPELKFIVTVEGQESPRMMV